MNALTPAQQARLDIRQKRHTGTSHGLARGYVVANLVVVRAPLAFEFLLYCQRNPKTCPVLEVTDPGCPEPKRLAPGPICAPICRGTPCAGTARARPTGRT